MSGDNPFDDLGALDESSEGSDDTGDSTETDADAVSASAEAGGTASADATATESASTSASVSDSDSDSESTSSNATAPSSGADAADSAENAGPAFPYDEVKQRPLYAREEAWAMFEDALELDVERILRENEVRDAQGRELHDAALRVAAEHPEAIAEQLLDARGIERDT